MICPPHCSATHPQVKWKRKNGSRKQPTEQRRGEFHHVWSVPYFLRQWTFPGSGITSTVQSRLSHIEQQLEKLDRIESVLGKLDQLQELKDSILLLTLSLKTSEELWILYRNNHLLSQENSSLKKKLQETDVQIEETDNYARRNNLEIKNLPYTDWEDTFEIVKKCGPKTWCHHSTWRYRSVSPVKIPKAKCKTNYNSLCKQVTETNS